MAIGDCYGINMGAEEVSRQPASGVFEEVSAIVKDGGTDAIQLWDGSNSIAIINAANITAGDIIDSIQAGAQPYNMAIKIGNTVYIRKAGTGDVTSVSGVQVDA